MLSRVRLVHCVGGREGGGGGGEKRRRKGLPCAGVLWLSRGSQQFSFGCGCAGSEFSGHNGLLVFPLLGCGSHFAGHIEEEDTNRRHSSGCHTFLNRLME